MDTADLFERLGLALAIGLLIGLERGWRERDEGDGTRTAGIRTYALIGLLGGLWGAMTPTLGPVPMAAAGLAFAAAFTLFEYRESVARKNYSVTATIVGLIVFALGAFAVLGNRAVAGAAGVAVVALLAARNWLHQFLRKLTWAELRSVVVLATMTFLLLPILPDMPIDPWDAINPYELWLLVVLIGAVSFAGYVAVRALGEQTGLAIGAAAGAIISSTTVTINYARLAAQASSSEGILSVAILIAWMVSLTRMTAIAVALNPVLFPLLGPPIGAALLILGFVAAFFLYHAGQQKTSTGRLFENPLDLRFVLQFGALLAAIIVATKLLRSMFGNAGILALAGITGFVDVDPITLSAARLSREAIMVTTAAEAILLAGTANLVTKMAATIVVGGLRLGWKLTLAGVLAVASGTLALVAMGIG
ncbi:MAG TPA: DUF4010 domain-containing protein [Micropepsaceae bacterium]|nr:DUF4010 domain-containing protein [Micropepsaceae bacterium]